MLRETPHHVPALLLQARFFQAEHRLDEALRLFTNALMSENLAMYAHIGFVETHRSVEKGFHRVYMRWILPNGAR